MPRFGMVIDTRKCVGCMDCVVACQTENDVPRRLLPRLDHDGGSRRVPESLDGDPLRALQPLRQPAVRLLLPDWREPCRGVRQGRARDGEQVHRLQGVHLGVPVRRPLRASGGLRGQVHVLLRTATKDGKDPACVSVCPTHCMTFGDLDDPKSKVSELLRTRK